MDKIKSERVRRYILRTREKEKERDLAELRQQLIDIQHAEWKQKRFRKRVKKEVESVLKEQAIEDSKLEDWCTSINSQPSTSRKGYNKFIKYAEPAPTSNIRHTLHSLQIEHTEELQKLYHEKFHTPHSTDAHALSTASEEDESEPIPGPASTGRASSCGCFTKLEVTIW